MIPQEVIEQVREATDIVQIVGEYVHLRKKGRDMWACCPFHTEKTASFKVSPDRQLFHCFGCGKGGNVFTFLIEHEGMSFADAVRFLAGRANITIRETRTDQHRDETERLNYAHEVAVDYFHSLLFQRRYAVVLDDYLKSKRGINDESIETFRIGLSGETWDGFLKHAAGKGLKPEELLKAGLIGKSEQKGTWYDRFRQRLMFPIYNLSNKPIAFGGRTLKKGESAKYVNSPETPLYSKSRVLYGLNFARDAIREQHFVYIVEGYFDLISLYQRGIRNVVASSGTAFTPQQARLLARFAEEAYLFFDADSAGRAAALRSVDSLFDSGLEVKVISAPQGEDPDSVARERGADFVEQLRAQALPYVEYRVRQSDVATAGIRGREMIIKEFAALAQKIEDQTRRSMLVQEASHALHMTAEEFTWIMSRKTGPDTGFMDFSTALNKEKDLLALLFKNPGPIDDVFKSLDVDDFDGPILRRLFAAMSIQYGRDGLLNSARLLESLQDSQLTSLVSELATVPHTPENVDSSTIQCLKDLEDRREKRHRLNLEQRLREAQLKGDEQEANAIFEELLGRNLIMPRKGKPED